MNMNKKRLNRSEAAVPMLERNEGTTDCVLVCRDGVLYAHQWMLSWHSPVLKKMFADLSHLQKVKLTTSKIPGIDPTIVSSYLAPEITVMVPDYSRRTVSALLDLIYRGQSRDCGDLGSYGQLAILGLYRDFGFEAGRGTLPNIQELSQVEVDHPRRILEVAEVKVVEEVSSSTASSNETINVREEIHEALEQGDREEASLNDSATSIDYFHGWGSVEGSDNKNVTENNSQDETSKSKNQVLMKCEPSEVQEENDDEVLAVDSVVDKTSMESEKLVPEEPDECMVDDKAHGNKAGEDDVSGINVSSTVSSSEIKAHSENNGNDSSDNYDYVNDLLEDSEAERTESRNSSIPTVAWSEGDKNVGDDNDNIMEPGPEDVEIVLEVRPESQNSSITVAWSEDGKNEGDDLNDNNIMEPDPEDVKMVQEVRTESQNSSLTVAWSEGGKNEDDKLDDNNDNNVTDPGPEDNNDNDITELRLEDMEMVQEVKSESPNCSQTVSWSDGEKRTVERDYNDDDNLTDCVHENEDVEIIQKVSDFMTNEPVSSEYVKAPVYDISKEKESGLECMRFDSDCIPPTPSILTPARKNKRICLQKSSSTDIKMEIEDTGRKGSSRISSRNNILPDKKAEENNQAEFKVKEKPVRNKKRTSLGEEYNAEMKKKRMKTSKSCDIKVPKMEESIIVNENDTEKKHHGGSFNCPICGAVKLDKSGDHNNAFYIAKHLIRSHLRSSPMHLYDDDQYKDLSRLFCNKCEHPQYSTTSVSSYFSHMAVEHKDLHTRLEEELHSKKLTYIEEGNYMTVYRFWKKTWLEKVDTKEKNESSPILSCPTVSSNDSDNLIADSSEPDTFSTDEKNIICGTCDREMASEKNLKIHILVNHLIDRFNNYFTHKKGEGFSCEYGHDCQYHGKVKSAILNHLYVKHSIVTTKDIEMVASGSDGIPKVDKGAKPNFVAKTKNCRVNLYDDSVDNYKIVGTKRTGLRESSMDSSEAEEKIRSPKEKSKSKKKQKPSPEPDLFSELHKMPLKRSAYKRISTDREERKDKIEGVRKIDENIPHDNPKLEPIVGDLTILKKDNPHKDLTAINEPILIKASKITKSELCNSKAVITNDKPITHLGSNKPVENITCQFWCKWCCTKYTNTPDIRKHIENMHPDKLPNVPLLEAGEKCYECAIKSCTSKMIRNKEKYMIHMKKQHGVVNKELFMSDEAWNKEVLTFKDFCAEVPDDSLDHLVPDAWDQPNLIPEITVPDIIPDIPVDVPVTSPIVLETKPVTVQSNPKIQVSKADHRIERLHSQPRTYVCQVCDRTFHYGPAVSKHIFLEHLKDLDSVWEPLIEQGLAGSDWLCQLCEESFTSRIHAQLHIYSESKHKRALKRSMEKRGENWEDTLEFIQYRIPPEDLDPCDESEISVIQEDEASSSNEREHNSHDDSMAEPEIHEINEAKSNSSSIHDQESSEVSMKIYQDQYENSSSQDLYEQNITNLHQKNASTLSSDVEEELLRCPPLGKTVDKCVEDTNEDKVNRPVAEIVCSHTRSGCKEVFLDRKDMHLHARVCEYRPSVNFTCQCGKRYYYQEDYQAHTLKCLPSKQLRCQKCNFSSPTAQGIAEHFKLTHIGEEEPGESSTPEESTISPEILQET